MHKPKSTKLRITRRRLRAIGVWLKLAAALRLPHNVRGGIAWTLGLPPMAGGEETPEEKAAREAREAEEAARAAAGNSVTMTKAEHDNLQRQLREATEARKKLEDDAAERQRKADEEAGNHAAIAQREKERADAAEARAAELERTTTTNERARLVERIAGTLKFRDPGDVLHRVPDTATSEADIKKALEAVAAEKRYLVHEGEIPKTNDVTGDTTGGGGGGGGGDASTQPTGVDRLEAHYAKTAAGGAGGGT